MGVASPVVLALARQLLLHEAAGSREPAALADATDRVCVRLRARLAGLIGQAGFAALLARALRLATAERPALAGITIDEGADAGLTGTRAFALAGTPAEAEAGLVAVLAHVIGLLVTFIGDDLGLHLVRGAWPELTHGEAGSPVRRYEHEQ